MNIACIKVDLAKQVFQVHGMDRTEKVLTRAIAPIADAGLFQQIDAMPDWHGSMWECALLLVHRHATGLPRFDMNSLQA